MTTDIKFTGLSELRNTFKNMPKQLSETALRSAAFAGADIICQEAKRNVSSITGTLADAVIVKRITENCTDLKQVYKVTVRKGRFGGPDGYYGRWVEFGHLIRSAGMALKGGVKAKQALRKTLASSGAAHVPAHPFMRPAFDAKSGEATQAIKDRLTQKIKEFTK